MSRDIRNVIEHVKHSLRNMFESDLWESKRWMLTRQLELTRIGVITLKTWDSYDERGWQKRSRTHVVGETQLNVPFQKLFIELLWEHLFRAQFFSQTLPAWTFICHQLMQRPSGNHSNMLLITPLLWSLTSLTLNIITIDNSSTVLWMLHCLICIMNWTWMIVIATTWEAQYSCKFTMISDVSVKWYDLLLDPHILKRSHTSLFYPVHRKSDRFVCLVSSTGLVW